MSPFAADNMPCPIPIPFPNRPPTSQTRRHKDTKTSQSYSSNIAKSPQITQMTQIRKEDLAETNRPCRGLTAEQSAIRRSSTAGGTNVPSKRERLLRPNVPPADAPAAHRFRLSSCGKWGVVPNCEIEGEWRGLRSAERRLLDRASATGACVRSGCPIQRSPAVVRRRLGPRHVPEFRKRPSELSA